MHPIETVKFVKKINGVLGFDIITSSFITIGIFTISALIYVFFVEDVYKLDIKSKDMSYFDKISEEDDKKETI